MICNKELISKEDQTTKTSILINLCSFILANNFVAQGQELMNEVKYLCNNLEVKEGREAYFLC